MIVIDKSYFHEVNVHFISIHDQAWKKFKQNFFYSPKTPLVLNLRHISIWNFL